MPQPAENQMTAMDMENTYPGVDMAYPLALASYEVTQKRFDAVDNRLQTLIAAGVTISLAVPIVASQRGLDYRTGWFFGAAISFVLAVAVGFFARLWGDLTVINPSHFPETWLHLSSWEFKKDMIYRAGEAFNKNKQTIVTKSRLGIISVILFLCEAILVVAWAVASS
jgi:hypothetical protein